MPFEPYGLSHFAMLALLALGVAAAVIIGRRVRGTTAERLARRMLAGLLTVTVLPWQVWTLLPDQWNPATSLPFELCDLAWAASIIALWTRAPWAYGLVYYWGLTLTVQAV